MALLGAQGHLKNVRKCLQGLACGAYPVFALFSAREGAARSRSAGLPPIPQTEARVADAVSVEHAPKLDGTLNDPLWLVLLFKHRNGALATTDINSFTDLIVEHVITITYCGQALDGFSCSGIEHQ